MRRVELKVIFIFEKLKETILRIDNNNVDTLYK